MRADADAEVRVGEFGRRLPDAAWLSPERAAQLDPNDEGPLPFCLDFVAPVSPSNRRGRREAKMQIWIEPGVQLAWPLDPFAGLADVYRADGARGQLARPSSLAGGDVLPGLTVDLSSVWRAVE